MYKAMAKDHTRLKPWTIRGELPIDGRITLLTYIILEQRVKIGNWIEMSLAEMMATNIYTKYRAEVKRNLDHNYLAHPRIK